MLHPLLIYVVECNVVVLGIRVDNGIKIPSIYPNDYGITIFMSTSATKLLWNDTIIVQVVHRMTKLQLILKI